MFNTHLYNMSFNEFQKLELKFSEVIKIRNGDPRYVRFKDILQITPT